MNTEGTEGTEKMEGLKTGMQRFKTGRQVCKTEKRELRSGFNPITTPAFLRPLRIFALNLCLLLCALCVFAVNPCLVSVPSVPSVLNLPLPFSGPFTIEGLAAAGVVG